MKQERYSKFTCLVAGLIMAICVVGLAFTPKACATTLVHDDFNGSALAPIWRLHQGYASVQGGWVTLSGSTPGTRGGYIVTGEGSTWSDYRLSTRAFVEGGGSACVEGPPCPWYVAIVKVRVQILRGNNRGTYYEVEMWTPPSEVGTGRGAFVALLKVVNDEVSVVREDLAPAGVINDYDNRLDIEVSGTRIRVYVNDQLITDYTDQTASPIMTGGVSLGALWESTTRYDYIYVDTAIPASCDGRDATIVGTNGNDVLMGTNGDDVIVGLGGDDVIYSLGGNDVLCGGPGNDLLWGGAGRDRLFGEDGEDVLRGGSGADYLVGGPGRDVLLGGAGNDRLFGEDGEDVLHGGDGADRLVGGRGRDTLFGGPGNDRLSGGRDTDYLHGGDGDDALNGGSGSDVCDGGRASTVDTADASCETVFDVP